MVFCVLVVVDVGVVFDLFSVDVYGMSAASLQTAAHIKEPTNNFGQLLIDSGLVDVRDHLLDHPNLS